MAGLLLVDLIPIPFPVLVTRLFRELERKQAAFDLPAKRFFTGEGAPDLSIALHGRRASTPFGPAAGPHTQMAQNIVLAWLAGGRVIELKTVQIKDRLTIPRPCIDMQTIGFNVEWSQELTLEQSLEEYVKAAMLIEMLKADGLAPGRGDTVFDMSVGYDLAGIRSERVRAFMEGLKDATAVVERLRAQIPVARFRDLPYPTRISDTLTLSTFHGCPPEEIERIAEFLLREVGLHVVVKLNPTLLGKDELTAVLHDRLGYRELQVPDAVFARDATWEQVQGFVGRLGTLAESLGRGFGVKFTNTLLVRNHKAFFPASEKEMYMSGAPLHVLAINLVRRFRGAFGDRFPISFSAGIDAANFADAVALGLTPVSVCTDLLKVGGYGRASRYLASLARRMEEVGAKDIDTFVMRAFGGPAADLAAARLRNTEIHAERVLEDPRYRAAQNAKSPKKVGSSLLMFDCLTCDKCIPACPNNANFSFAIPQGTVPVQSLAPSSDGWTVASEGVLAFRRPWQIGTFADACNECGNCDVICPEDGGPFRVKPLFFGSVESWQRSNLDGFALQRTAYGLRMVGRCEGRSLALDRVAGGGVRYRGEGFDVTFDPADPAATAAGTAAGPVDLTWAWIMILLRDAVTAGENYVSAGLGSGPLSAPLGGERPG